MTKYVRPTIKDVAKVSGVSKSTVSRVLNGSLNVSIKSREKIQSAIDELGYVPNSAARRLIIKKSKLIGLFIQEIENPYYLPIIRGAEDIATKFDYGMVLIYGTKNKLGIDSIKEILEIGVDGILYAGVLTDDEMFSLLLKWEVPYVLLGRKLKELESNYVVFEDYTSAYKGVKYLIDLNHQNIGYIFGKANSFSSEERLYGYQDALKDAGIEFKKELVEQGDLSFEGGYHAAKLLLKLDEPPTAILAGNDLMALGAREYILESGLKIPDDISIIGMDGIAWTGIQGVELSTISTPGYEMGHLAGEILIRQIKNPKRGNEHYVLPTKFIIRNSCKKLNKKEL